MKKLTAILLALTLLLALAACGGDKPTEPAAQPTTQNTQNEPSAANEEPSATGEIKGELYDAGNVTVFVPEGWKAFPQADVFSDEEGAVNPDVLRVCKGGETDWDLFSKPNIQINYWGPSVTGMLTDKDWYDNAEDIDPITTGEHNWIGYKGESLGSKLIILFEDLGNIQYQATLWYETDGGSISLEDPDVLAILASPFASDGTVPTGAAAGTEPTEEPGGAGTVEADYEWWERDWYGWWCVRNAAGMYEGLNDIAWDAYAHIDVYYDDTGLLQLWSDTATMYSALCNCWLTFEPGTDGRGRLVSDTGSFFDSGEWLGRSVEPGPIDAGDWDVDPTATSVSHFENMVEIVGHYVDPENEANYFDYYIYLRPWGARWEDVESGDTSGCIYRDMMPIHYTDWYLPLLEQGVTEAPESYDEGLSMLG